MMAALTAAVLLVMASRAVTVLLPSVSLAAAALLPIVSLSVTAMRFKLSPAVRLAAVLLPSASVVLVESWTRARSALPVLTLIASDNSLTRVLSRSPAVRLRTSSCWVTASARPMSRCSSWPMRPSSVLATSTAREPSVLSILAMRVPTASDRLAARVSISVVTSVMRRSSAVTTSLRPSARVLAISLTLPASASVRELGAVGLHGGVELGEVPGDEVAQRRGVARDLLAELGAGMAEHLLERGKPRRQHVLHGVATCRNGVDELLDARAQRVVHAGAA